MRHPPLKTNNPNKNWVVQTDSNTLTGYHLTPPSFISTLVPLRQLPPLLSGRLHSIQHDVLIFTKIRWFRLILNSLIGNCPSPPILYIPQKVCWFRLIVNRPNPPLITIVPLQQELPVLSCQLHSTQYDVEDFTGS